jgi:hypothetical protein
MDPGAWKNDLMIAPELYHGLKENPHFFANHYFPIFTCSSFDYIILTCTLEWPYRTISADILNLLFYIVML